jgi:ATP-dependent RNA helicase DDX52/ROK1
VVLECPADSFFSQKRDLLACAPTGSGKTLSFLLPLLVLNPPNPDTTSSLIIRPTSIIIEPTRELAMQVLRETARLAEGGGWGIKVLGEDERAKGGEKGKGKKGRKGKKGKGKKVEEKVAKSEDEDEDESDESGEEEGAAEPVVQKQEVEEEEVKPATPTGELPCSFSFST